jgi:hypothetical protein
MTADFLILLAGLAVGLLAGPHITALGPAGVIFLGGFFAGAAAVGLAVWWWPA